MNSAKWLTILMPFLLSLSSAITLSQERGGSLRKCSELRVQYTPFDENYSQRIILREAANPGTSEPEGNKVYSPQHTAWVSQSSPDYSQPGHMEHNHRDCHSCRVKGLATHISEPRERRNQRSMAQRETSLWTRLVGKDLFDRLHCRRGERAVHLQTDGRVRRNDPTVSVTVFGSMATGLHFALLPCLLPPTLTSLP
jgi:hypothetical protein